MFTKRIIPCLDVNAGRVVKGVNFVDLKDAGDPVEIAKAYDKAGADELVFLDITASSDNRATVVDMVRKVAECVFIPFTVGGGIRTVDDFRAVLREGADKISVNSAAINTPELVREAADKFGSQCVVVAIDAKKRADGSGWNIYKNGGRIDVGIDVLQRGEQAHERVRTRRGLRGHRAAVADVQRDSEPRKLRAGSRDALKSAQRESMAGTGVVVRQVQYELRELSPGLSDRDDGFVRQGYGG